jgi:TolA-binding protein
MKAVVEATAAAGLHNANAMSISNPSGNDSIDVSADNLTAVVKQLAERVTDLEDRVADLEEDKADLEQENADLEDRVADLEAETARQRAEDRQRLTDAEDRLEDLEDGGTPTSDPTPEAKETASTTSLTPIERLSESGDHADVATNVTASVRRAVELFDHLPDWGSSTPKGRVLKPADRPKQLLEAATDESLAWTQYYRAAEALERLSKGAITFFDHQKHGKTLVLHEGSDVHDRATQSKTGRQQSSLVG